MEAAEKVTSENETGHIVKNGIREKLMMWSKAKKEQEGEGGQVLTNNRNFLHQFMTAKMPDIIAGMRQPEGPLIQFKNCRILWQHQIIREDLWVRNGIIQNPEKIFFDEKVVSDIHIECKGLIIAPGFIDAQINGAFGVDFSFLNENLVEGVKKVSKGLLAHGVTSYCPTVITSPPEVYKHVLGQIKRQNGSKDGAGVLGLHLEGPFISKEKKGAHPEELIRDLDNGFQGLIDMYGTLSNVSIITLAPEIKGATEVIRELVDRGVIVSVGHSVSNLSEGEGAVKAGASFITHLFNAMLPFHHRDPHLVGLLASDKLPQDKTVYYGMISDGIHGHGAAIRIAYRTHPEGIVLVTDAIPAMGFSAGKHHIGQQVVEIKDNRATIAGTNTLCGSIATMNECVKFFYNAAGCTKEEAIEGATLHPARLLNVVDEKGTLDYGTHADLIFLDDELNVHYTFIAGEQVWSRPDADELLLTHVNKKL